MEEGGREPSPEVAEPVGRGLSRVAHRMLRDVDQAPRRPLRRAHRRQRQQVPASRGRDRAVGGGRGASGGVDLGARRIPADGRAEDGQVREEHQAGDRSRRRGHRPAGLPLVHVPDPVSDREMDFTWEAHGDGRPSGEAAPPPRRGVGPAHRRSRSRREGARFASSARPSRTTSTCRPPSVW